MKLASKAIHRLRINHVRLLLLNPDVCTVAFYILIISNPILFLAHRASAGSGSSRAAGSSSSRAPSSYHRKRARLSTTPESRPGSRASVDARNATNTGSLSSKGSSLHMPQAPRPLPAAYHRDSSRRSLSQASVPGSIPMSALISPHAPSIPGSSVFHMRDPRKPPPIQPTPWSLSLPSGGGGSWLDRGGSPLHAWLFFVGFLIFPIWWVAAFVGIPRTRRLGGNELEKGVVLDDPQVEFGQCFLQDRLMDDYIDIFGFQMQTHGENAVESWPPSHFSPMSLSLFSLQFLLGEILLWLARHLYPPPSSLIDPCIHISVMLSVKVVYHVCIPSFNIYLISE
jgi:hypothetical protein